MIVDQTIEKEKGLLLRWKCPGCNRTATDYPKFALPYKRYTLPTILAFSQAYVEEPRVSYRQLVDTCPLPYRLQPGSDTDREPELAHSSIHRWITTLGGYCGIVKEATSLMLQADPTTALCRDLAGLLISPGKYLSPARKQILFTCLHLVSLIPAYQSMFGASIFPKLATRSGFS